MAPTLDRCAPSILTPLHLEILIWYHTRGVDMPTLGAPATQEYLKHFLDDGILRPTCGASRCVSDELTEKGDAFLEALLMVKYPIQRWVME